jgi:hypothetical protein
VPQRSTRSLRRDLDHRNVRVLSACAAVAARVRACDAPHRASQVQPPARLPAAPSRRERALRTTGPTRRPGRAGHGPATRAAATGSRPPRPGCRAPADARLHAGARARQGMRFSLRKRVRQDPGAWRGERWAAAAHRRACSNQSRLVLARRTPSARCPPANTPKAAENKA